MPSNFYRTTPQLVKDIRDTLIYAIAGSLAFTPLLIEWLNMDAAKFAMVSGFAIFVVKVIAKFFGVSDEEAQQNVANAKDELKKIEADKK